MQLQLTLDDPPILFEILTTSIQESKRNAWLLLEQVKISFAQISLYLVLYLVYVELC